MITRLKLKPGQRGTKALVEQHGDALVCIRFRYDAASRTRFKTVELVVEKTVVVNKASHQQQCNRTGANRLWRKRAWKTDQIPWRQMGFGCKTLVCNIRQDQGHRT